ncbi:MAG: hypothetical protein M3331_04370 [Actinomycetota bacterium]|nr:hypothetical protein [Actinomycetota bacterium]
MAFTTVEARDRIIGDLEAAEEELGFAVACLGEAFELLASGSADRLENELFRPVQKAYVRTKRTRLGFAQRVAQDTDEPESKPVGPPSQGAKGFVEQATTATAQADSILSDLQDSMMPVEGGDAELRAGLIEVRELLGPVPSRGRGFLSTLGR